MRLYFTPFYITAQNKQILINYQIFLATYLKKVVNSFFPTYSLDSQKNQKQACVYNARNGYQKTVPL